MLKLIFLSCLVAVCIANPLNIGEVLEDGPIDIKDANYQVSLFNSSTGKIFCSGSIVSKHFILTTGNCVRDRVGNILIRVGTSFNDRGGDVFVSERVIIHPRFNRWQLDFDFALIQVGYREIDFNENQGPAELATVAPNATETVSIIGQWEGSNLLKRKSAKAITDQECHNLLYVGINPRTFCSLTFEPFDDCISFDGAPVVMNGKLVGMLTGQTQCFVFVNSNIAYVNDWINQYIY